MFRKLKLSQLFTLIELLVVIAIISILASMLLPTLNKARARGKLISCISNQKNLGTFSIFYTNDYNDYMPSACRDAGGSTAPPRQQIMSIKSEHFSLGWVYSMGPYWEATSTWLIKKFNPVFTCPAGVDDSYAPTVSGVKYPTTNYAYTTRLGGTSTDRDIMRKISRCSSPSKAGYLIDIDTKQRNAATYNAIYPYSACDSVYPLSMFRRHNQKINILFADGHINTLLYPNLKLPDGEVYTLGWADSGKLIWK